MSLTRPRTLYLRRYLLNGQAVLDWAAANGAGGEPAKAAAMHSTIVYSRRALDWTKVVPDLKPLVVENGRRRSVEHLTGNALALIIDAPELVERNHKLLRLGASGDYHPYRPHVTFAYGFNIASPAGRPYPGALSFGPEVMSPVPVRGSDV